jgi:hypothetical protein
VRDREGVWVAAGAIGVVAAIMLVAALLPPSRTDVVRRHPRRPPAPTPVPSPTPLPPILFTDGLESGDRSAWEGTMGPPDTRPLTVTTPALRLFFDDGYESGDTSAWRRRVPPPGAASHAVQ